MFTLTLNIISAFQPDEESEEEKSMAPSSQETAFDDAVLVITGKDKHMNSLSNSEEMYLLFSMRKPL